MVSEGYLSKIKFALRTVSIDSNVELEITDIIEECRAHMIAIGVNKEVAEDEEEDISTNMADYRLQVDELRKAVTDNADS